MKQPRRPRYFTGKLLTATDFQMEQDYHREKRQLLNRTLHGSGTVCGLAVVPASPPEPDRVVVEPGLALDGLGREIVVSEPAVVDLGEVVDGAESGEGRKTHRVFVVLEYDEEEIEPHPVFAAEEPPGAEVKGEASVILETYRLTVRRSPASTARDQGGDGPERQNGETAPREGARRRLYELVLSPCAPGTGETALTLAAVETGPGEVTAERIDNMTFRPIVRPSARSS